MLSALQPIDAEEHPKQRQWQLHQRKWQPKPFGGIPTGSTITMASHGEKGNQRLRRITSVQPGALSYEELVKEGTFGRIYAGKLGESCEALVKTVIDGASLTQVACLLQDASLLIGVSHQHILAPLLANTELPGPPEIAYPHPSKGNLKM